MGPCMCPGGCWVGQPASGQPASVHTCLPAWMCSIADPCHRCPCLRMHTHTCRWTLFFTFTIIVSGLIATALPGRLVRARFPLANLLSIAAVLIMVSLNGCFWRAHVTVFVASKCASDSHC